MEDLEKKIEERKIQAKENKISEKIDVVVSVLGQRVLQAHNDHSKFVNTVYFIDSLYVQKSRTSRDFDGIKYGYDTHFARFNDKIVYLDWNGGLEFYIPGKWEQLLEREYERARKENTTTPKVLPRECSEDYRENIRIKWGI